MTTTTNVSIPNMRRKRGVNGERRKYHAKGSRIRKSVHPTLWALIYPFVAPSEQDATYPVNMHGWFGKTTQGTSAVLVVGRVFGFGSKLKEWPDCVGAHPYVHSLMFHGPSAWSKAQGMSRGRKGGGVGDSGILSTSLSFVSPQQFVVHSGILFSIACLWEVPECKSWDWSTEPNK